MVIVGVVDIYFVSASDSQIMVDFERRVAVQLPPARLRRRERGLAANGRFILNRILIRRITVCGTGQINLVATYCGHLIAKAI
jgi:hypothetical protein